MQCHHLALFRLPELDQKLLKQRMLQEVRCIVRCCREGIRTPGIYFVDIESSRLYLEYINGQTAKRFFLATGTLQPQPISYIMPCHSLDIFRRRHRCKISDCSTDWRCYRSNARRFSHPRRLDHIQHDDRRGHATGELHPFLKHIHLSLKHTHTHTHLCFRC